MPRDHRNSGHDVHDQRQGGDGDAPWPGKRSRTDELRGVVRPFGGGAGDGGRADAAAAAIDGKGAGAPLAAPLADAAERAYGTSMGDVRVHTDAGAAGAASRMGAEAFTHGSDVYVGGGLDAATPHGQFVMMHELAHVAQQRGAEPAPQAKLEVGEGHDPAEREADAAAEAAMEGRTAQITRHGGRLRMFGAGTVKYNPKAAKGSKYTVEAGGHAFMTVDALKEMGLDADQAALGYQGNWMRDLSQAMVPGLVEKLKAENLLAILQMMSIKEFGRGFDTGEFGTYDPVEHMDNPTDLRASDVFQQYEKNPDGTPKGLDPEGKIPLANVVNVDDPGQAMAAAGSGDQAYGDVDGRYAETAKNMGGLINTSDAVPFQVNASGIPVYMNTSKDWLKRQLRDSALTGRDDPKGPRLFGSGIHVMQDYYAHSNFCEIAINVLIKEGNLALPDESGHGTSKIDKAARLDSHVHKNGPDGEPIKTVNMKVKDLPGFKGKPGEGDREVMSTGSFNLTDTAVSLLHVMKEKVIALNPFKEKGKGPSELTNACLDYLDMAKPDGFNKTGQKIAALIRPVGEAIAAVGDGVASGVEGAGNLAGGAVKGGAGVGADFFDLLNKGNALLGGDADYWDAEKKAVTKAGQAGSDAITGETGAAAKKIREVTSWLDKKADEIEKREHILRDLYGWASGIDMLAPVKAMARAIPIVGEKVAKLIEDLQKKIKEKSEELLDDLWVAAVKLICDKIQGVIDWLTKRTNIKDKKKAGKPGQKAGPDFLPDSVRKMLGDKQAEVERLLGGVGDMYDASGKPKNGIAPGSYTPPSHSEVAKDHHHAESAVQPGGGDHDHEGEHDHGDDHGHDHDAPESDGDAHAHASDWLNELAESLATSASKGIGAKVAGAWDERAAGAVSPQALSAIDKEVDAWFAHPEDCRGKWEGTAMKFLNRPAIAARLRKELAKGVK